MQVDYTHVELNQEITSISGHYVLLKEARLPFRGREVLYLVGNGVVDNSCCGSGGWAYALVPGFVVEWQTRETAEGRPLSRVEPVRDDEIQRQVRAAISEIETISQVNFA